MWKRRRHYNGRGSRLSFSDRWDVQQFMSWNAARLLNAVRARNDNVQSLPARIQQWMHKPVDIEGNHNRPAIFYNNTLFLYTLSILCSYHPHKPFLDFGGKKTKQKTTMNSLNRRWISSSTNFQLYSNLRKRNYLYTLVTTTPPISDYKNHGHVMTRTRSSRKTEVSWLLHFKYTAFKFRFVHTASITKENLLRLVLE